MYLIDTNVVSEFRKFSSGRADPNVVRWFLSANAVVTRNVADFASTGVTLLNPSDEQPIQP